MHVSYQTGDPKALSRMIQKAQEINRRLVQVGVFDGYYAWLAGIHEYGCHIPVTPKMLAWLHYQGIHLKKSTTEIIIPERSFLRAGFDQKNEEVLSQIEAALKQYLISEETADMVLKITGRNLASEIKKYARDLHEPAKSSASYQLGTRNSNPLVETGYMIAHITFQLDNGGGE